MTSPALGLLFGFINTTSLHLAKGMQRHGINTLRWRKLPVEERNGKHAFIYIVGFILNNSTPVWIVLANRFAAPAYATGMFGVGLVLLLIYSSTVLKERVRAINYAGAALVVLGTGLFSLHAVRSGDIDVSLMDSRTVSIFIIIYMAIASVAMLAAIRSRNSRRVALSFGAFAGGAACLDPILKSIGQHASGTASILPTELAGWLPFGLSFVLGVSAFITVQAAFLRGAEASIFVPLQSSIYILVPVIVQLIALPGYTATPVLVAGMACILAGIALTQLWRSNAAAVPEIPPESHEPGEEV